MCISIDFHLVNFKEKITHFKSSIHTKQKTKPLNKTKEAELEKETKKKLCMSEDRKFYINHCFRS